MNGALWLAAWPWQAASGTAGPLLEQLGRASVVGALFAAAVWAVMRLSPKVTASLRCALWWAVSLKFLVTLVWFAPVEVPLLPALAETTSIAASEAQTSRPRTARESTRTERAAADNDGQHAPTPLPPMPWREVVVLLWLLGVSFGAFGIGRELAAARRLRRESRLVDDPRIRQRFATLGRRLGIRRHVALHVSEQIRVPLTIGWLRPLILVPSSTLAQLRERELSMVLGHELMHVRRWDLWTAWVPRLARCVFFFHPLATVAAREYALAREAACDAAVVHELDVAPRDYGRLLVRTRPSPAHSAVVDGVGCAAASSSFLHLKRRLEMLERRPMAAPRLRLAHWIFALVLFAAVVPVRIIAQPQDPVVAETPRAQNGTGSFQRTVAVDEPVQLDVRTGSGSVTVRRGSAGEVRVAGRIVIRPGHSSTPDEAAELIRRFETDPPLEVSGGLVRLGHNLDRDYQRNVSISYDIEVPSATEVRSRTGSGSQEITGVSGPIEAHTGSGSIALTDIGDAVQAQTGSGSIRAEGIAGAFSARTGSGSVTLAQTAAGDVNVATGSGSSTLRGIDGALRVRTGSGGITVDGQQAGPWELQTGSGSIRIRLPADAGFELDAHTGSGRIETNHPVTVQGSINRNRLSGQVRGGGPLLQARTGSGSVRIE